MSVQIVCVCVGVLVRVCIVNLEGAWANGQCVAQAMDECYNVSCQRLAGPGRGWRSKMSPKQCRLQNLEYA